ncbi:MAG: hypothetical protein OXR67_05750 [Chloroflexota bacterium]|nr:hypothetical protein [Chloroflexota bacterium]
MNELVDILKRYFEAAADLREIAEWLAGVDWDDPELTEDEREALGMLLLLVTEVSENMREEAELRTEASRFLADRSSPAYR